MREPQEDTIVAVSTPPGRGGLAVVRLSGPEALDVAASLGAEGLSPRETKLRVLRDGSGQAIDRALVTWFREPASYTGESVVEISCHGGALVPALLVDAACEAGARTALPGEFTRRAYLNGKLDLIQAEATLDLIDATSVQHHHAAMRQLGGALSSRVAALRERLLELQAAVAYDIDFPEEDDGPIDRAHLLELAHELEQDAAELLRHAPEGERLRNGVLTVLAGAPNVGKSTIFNELQGFERAIVTELPGTTRDAIEADVSIEGYPFRLVDTAGIRSDAERIEKIGIEIARGYVERADVLLLCVESGQSPSSADLETASRAEAAGAEVVWVHTKADIVGESATNGGGEAPLDAGQGEDAPKEDGGADAIRISARTGDGLSDLRDALLDRGFSGLRSGGEPALVTRRRQARAIEAAIREVRDFRTLVSEGHPAEIASTHLQQATWTLEELVGATDVEDVLEVIFRSFCVGK